MKTTGQMLVESINRANEQHMVIIKSGQVNSEDFIIVRDNRAYVVKVKDKEITSCTCGQYEVRGQICKHMIKLSTAKGLPINAEHVDQID